MQNSNQTNQDQKKAEKQGDQQTDMKRAGQDQERTGKMDPNRQSGDVEEGSEREDLQAGKSSSQGGAMSGQPGKTNQPNMTNKSQGTDTDKAMGNAGNRQQNQGNSNDRGSMRQDQDVDTDGKTEQNSNRKNQ